MGFLFLAVTISTILFVIVSSIVAMKYYKSVQADYNSKLYDIVNQVNTVQSYEFVNDKSKNIDVDALSNTAGNLKNTYPTKTDLEQNLYTKELAVGNNLKANQQRLEANNIIFSNKITANKTDEQSEILNDTTDYKKLMLIGNRMGGERRVGIMDNVEVQGGLQVDKDINASTIYGKESINVGDSYIRKDGYIYGGAWVDGQNVLGRDMIKVGSNAVYMRKDGYVYADKSIYSKGSIDAPSIQGRDSVSTGYSTLNKDGTISGKQMCIGGVCLSKTDLIKLKTSNLDPAVNCSVSHWTDWSACTKTCGGGVQSRTRSVLIPPKNGGSACPLLEELQACGTTPCVTNCEVNDWSAWSLCSAPCGGGTMTRSRTIKTYPANGGTACPSNLSESMACGTAPCNQVVNCATTAWSDWSTCSAPCGGGSRTRSRTITQNALNGGTACPVLSETQQCNTQACASDCQVSTWSEWGSCSAPCGGGTRTRSRTITVQPIGGATCPPLLESQQCNTQTCIPAPTTPAPTTPAPTTPAPTTPAPTTPAPLVFDILGIGTDNNVYLKTAITAAWSLVSSSCCVISITQLNDGTYVGVGTDNKLYAKATLNGSWSLIGDGGCCVTSISKLNDGRLLGVGTDTKLYIKATPTSPWTAVGDNSCCVISAIQLLDGSILGVGTNNQLYTKTSLTANWAGPITNGCCVKSIAQAPNGTIYGVGTDNKVYYKTTLTGTWTYGGDNTCCVKSIAISVRMPVNCQVSAWSAWNNCSVSCGGGTQTRTRTVTVQAANGGAACPALIESQPCNTAACPINCQVSAWSAWNNCSASCGGGTQTRTRSVLTQPSNGGTVCPALIESQPCNTSPCVTDTLGNNGTLNINQTIKSPDGRFTFIMQGDGNAVIYGPSGPTWATNTNGTGANRIVMQGDGNLVVYTAGGAAPWASFSRGPLKWGYTDRVGPYRLVMQGDGNLVVYDARGAAVWACCG